MKTKEKIIWLVFSLVVLSIVVIIIGLFQIFQRNTIPLKNCVYYDDIKISCTEENKTIECYASNRICDGKASLDINQSSYWNITHHYLFGGYDLEYINNYFKQINSGWNVSLENVFR